MPVVDDSDWRLQGQERYLQGAALEKLSYSPSHQDWDHDHCEFCGAKFAGKDTLDAAHEGFTTSDRCRWICSTCFGDFRVRFGWSLIERDR
jgi:hypothetical protein